MTPTPKLRFVERSVPLHPFYKTFDAQGNTVQTMQTVHILQQWWATQGASDNEVKYELTGEWRDVPVEKEQA
jgi:hypothetical protein